MGVIEPAQVAYYQTGEGCVIRQPQEAGPTETRFIERYLPDGWEPYPWPEDLYFNSRLLSPEKAQERCNQIAQGVA